MGDNKIDPLQQSKIYRNTSELRSYPTWEGKKLGYIINIRPYYVFILTEFIKGYHSGLEELPWGFNANCLNLRANGTK